MKLLALIPMLLGAAEIRFDYPAEQIPRVEFWLEGCTNIQGTNWQTIAFIVPPLTNQMEFYRIGVTNK